MKNNFYQIFKKNASRYKSRPAVGWKEGRSWKSLKYKEVLKRVDYLAENLLELGVKRKEKVAILSENCPEWLMTDLALNKLRAISVPLHYTSNLDLIEYILKKSESKYMVVSNSLFQKNKDILNFDFLNKVIVIGANKKDLQNNKVVNFKDLLRPNQNNKVNEDEAEKNDLLSIIFTSGTTGKPKGVMLTNYNFISNTRSACEAIFVYPEDRFLSFLPLSHILERTAGHFVPLFSGASVYYAESIKKLPQNLKEVNPSILISVPRIFNKTHEKIFAKIKKSNFLIRKLFFCSLNKQGNFFLKFLANAIVYKKIKKVFGKNLRFAISGGASINKNILLFFKKIGITITEGYGLTETSPLISVNRLDNIKEGTVGELVSGVEIKIASDKEVLVKGNNVTQGYWKNEELNYDHFDEEGWFKTGDLGFLDKEGFLTIIGRKKEIIVTTNGKNISPEKIENLINLSPYIEQSLVVGHKRRYLHALIVPDFESAPQFKQDKEMKEFIKKEINKINKKLEKHENIENIEILKKPFTIEENELTPTMKLKRKVVEAKYKDLIDKTYS